MVNIVVTFEHVLQQQKFDHVIANLLDYLLKLVKWLNVVSILSTDIQLSMEMQCSEVCNGGYKFVPSW
jgi:hypothetical protein